MKMLGGSFVQILLRLTCLLQMSKTFYAEASPPVWIVPSNGSATTVIQNSLPGTEIIILFATDGDNDAIVYTVESQVPSTPVFLIGGVNNDTLLVPSGLDNVTTTLFTITFGAFDNQTKSISAPLTINVVEYTVPVFSYTASVTDDVLPADGTYKLVCYYSNWSQYRTGIGKFLPGNIRPNLCTHLIYAFAKVEGNVMKMVEWNDDKLYKEFNDLKQSHPKLRTLIGVGGWNAGSQSFSEMVATEGSRNTFINSVIEWLPRYGFDGLDLDWEYPAAREGSSPQDKDNYVKLLKELVEVFKQEALTTGRERFLLTAAVPAGKETIDNGFNVREVARYLDFINLMTYDLHGTWEDVTGMNSPLYPRTSETGAARQLNMQWAANYWVSQGAPKHKLIIGMASYGRTFTLADSSTYSVGASATGPGKAGKYTREKGFMAYYEICGMEETEAGSVYWDAEQHVPYYVNGDLWVGYDNVKSIYEKAVWIREEGLGGAMVWSLELDDFNKVCTSSSRKYPLLSTIYDVLISGKIPTTQTPKTTKSTKTTGTTTTTTTTTHSAALADGTHKLVCYYSNWSQYRTGIGKFLPGNIRPNLCTHLIYAFAKVEGNVMKMVEWNDDKLYKEFNDLKQSHPKLRTLIGVGGWNAGSQSFSKMVATEGSRNTFINSVIEWLPRYGFDGLDLDWEYPAAREGSSPQDKDNYVKLLKELVEVFKQEALTTGRERFLLTAAVPAGKETIDNGFNVREVARYLDFINLMTYDLHGTWEDVTGMNSPLYPRTSETGAARQLNMQWAANYWVSQGAPKHKLIIGMASYGRTFTLADSSKYSVGASATDAGKAGKYTREKGFMAYYEICGMEETEAGSVYWDAEQHVPYYVNGDLWVGYDNVKSIYEKAVWVKEEGLGGAMVWSLELDDFNKVCTSSSRKYPLLSTIYDVLISGKIPTTQTPKTTKSTKTTGTTTTTTTTTHSAALEFSCKDRSDGFYADPLTKTKFYGCVIGQAYHFDCPAGLIYNPVLGSCDWPPSR